MKIAPNLDFTVVKPEPKSLDSFVQMIKKVYQNFVQAFNGNIGFGDGTNLDNINGSWINVVAPVGSNTDFTVNHNLGRLPSGYWIMQKDRACDVYTGSLAATKTQLTLRASAASAVLRLFIISIILMILSNATYGQGAVHTNTAFKSSTVPSTSGLTGNLIQPVPGALITVCNGSTVPSFGVTCTGLANIFSDIALTQQISNPTNADSNGNYVFYAAQASSFVISVGGVGLTTYSYVWTSPFTTNSGVALLSANQSFTGQNNFTQRIVAPTIGPSVGQQHVLPTITSDVFGLLSATQTFLNKTLTSPLINTSLIFNTANQITITPTNPAAPRSYTLPDFGGSDSFVGLAAAQNLTNKTLTTPIINGASTGTGVQGTDAKLLTSATLSNNLPLCSDANGGATTTGCGATKISVGHLAGAGCTTGNTTYSTCTNTITVSPAQADTTYMAVCNGTGPTDPRALIQTSVAASTTTITATTITEGSVAVNFGDIWCSAIHP